MMHLPGRLVALLGVFGLGSPAFVGTAAARGAAGGGEPLKVAIIGGLAVSAGLLAGLTGVAQQSPEWRWLSLDWLKVAVGPLLVALGLAAMVTAAGRHPGIAGVGGGLGTVAVWGVMSDGIEPAPDDYTVCGAAVVHRAVEGLILAAAYVAGSVVALLGATVLAGHVTAGTATRSGFYSVGRVRATGTVLVVYAGFVAGSMATLAVVGRVPKPLRLAALAFVGGTLLVVGLVETNIQRLRRPALTPDKS